MVLPSLFSKKNTDNQTARLFLALLITDSTIQAGFWEVSQQSISMRQHSGVFSYSDAKTLLLETDKALQELGKASESVEQVIFGLEFNWVDEQGIADVKKPMLKKLTKELALQPVGFVVSTEALFHSLIADDPQLSTLLIQYAVDYITVSIITRGKLINSERVGRSEDPGADIQEATARLLANQDNPVLPAKVHLVSPMVDTTELKTLKTKLAEFDWKEVNPKVNHQPVVEVLPVNAMLEAVVQEGGKAVADAQGYTISGSLEKMVEDSSQGVPRSAAVQDKMPQQSFDNATSVQNPFADQFSSPGASDPIIQPSSQSDNQTGIAGNKNPFKAAMATMPFFSKKTPKDYSHQSHKSSAAVDWMSHHLKFVGGGFAAGLLALLAIGYVSLISAKTAIIELTLAAKSVSNEVAITLDPTIDQSSPEDLLLKAELVKAMFSESKSIDTTGVELVGDEATGRVTVTNKTDDSVTIGAGTQLVGGGVTFTLDEEIRIASSSVSENDEGETKTYGKTDASVTAVKVGSEGNIGSGVSFSVGTYGQDVVAAESSEAFTGGSSREVRVFSQEDKEVLLAEVKKMVLATAEKEYREKSDAGVYTIPTGELTIADSNYSAEVGDEVSSVSLDIEAEVTAVTYLTEDVKSLVGFALKDQIPDRYQLSEKEPSILSQADEDATASASQVVLNTNISAQALPTFDDQAFKNEVLGQSPSSAEAILRGKAEIEEAVVKLNPGYVRFISGSVPKKVDKIIFSIVN